MNGVWLRAFPFRPRRGVVFGGLIVTALVFFEIFNFSTTDFALRDLLGEMRFIGIHWATILAVAFCGIDFAGIARIFTPETGSDEPMEVWYLFGAWLLAAVMNAINDALEPLGVRNLQMPATQDKVWRAIRDAA